MIDKIAVLTAIFVYFFPLAKFFDSDMILNMDECTETGCQPLLAKSGEESCKANRTP